MFLAMGNAWDYDSQQCPTSRDSDMICILYQTHQGMSILLFLQHHIDKCIIIWEYAYCTITGCSSYITVCYGHPLVACIVRNNMCLVVYYHTSYNADMATQICLWGNLCAVNHWPLRHIAPSNGLSPDKTVGLWLF